MQHITAEPKPTSCLLESFPPAPVLCHDTPPRRGRVAGATVSVQTRTRKRCARRSLLLQAFMQMSHPCTLEAASLASVGARGAGSGLRIARGGRRTLAPNSCPCCTCQVIWVLVSDVWVVSHAREAFHLEQRANFCICCIQMPSGAAERSCPGRLFQTLNRSRRSFLSPCQWVNVGFEVGTLEPGASSRDGLTSTTRQGKTGPLWLRLVPLLVSPRCKLVLLEAALHQDLLLRWGPL